MAHAFDAPIFLHEADRQWVMRKDPSIVFWRGETHSLLSDLTLVRCGGHFAGGQVLFCPNGAERRGAMLTGDIISVVPDRGWVSFMYSYPNLIPLPTGAVEKIAAAVEPFRFDRIYGAWWPRVIPEGAKLSVRRSADRYIKAISEARGPH